MKAAPRVPRSPDKIIRAKPPALTATIGRTVEYVRNGSIQVGVLASPSTTQAVDIKDIDGSKHRVAADQLISMWPAEFGTIPHAPPSRALPSDARLLRELWDRIKGNSAPLATVDITSFLYGTLSPSNFARCANLLSRQRSFFRRGAPLTGWVPMSASASVNAQRNSFREEALEILEKKRESFDAPEHAETLDDLALYYYSSLYGSRNAYMTRQTGAASLLQSFGRSRSPEEAAQLLIDLGYWCASSSSIRTFTALQRAASFALLNQPQTMKDESASFRKDLTRHAAFWPRRDAGSSSIALGHQVREDGSSWLLVHLPDLRRWLLPDSTLRECAKQQLTSYSASHYRLPLLPSLAEQAVAFHGSRFNNAVTVAFSDSVSERKSEIFLSKISPVLEVNPEVLSTLGSATYSDRLRAYGIGRRTFGALRKVTAAVAPPSTAHESFWTAVSGLRSRAVIELRSFLASMKAPHDPSAFATDSYLNILAHDQLHALLGGKAPCVTQEELHSAKQAIDARLAALTSDFGSLSAAAPELLLGQARRQQKLLGLDEYSPVELLGVALQSGNAIMIHPTNQIARPRTAEHLFGGAFVRAEMNVSNGVIEKITKL